MDVKSFMENETSVDLESAILLYNADGKQGSLATINPVRRIDQGPHSGSVIIGEGRPLTMTVLSKVIRQLAGGGMRRQILPERLLFADATRMLWYVPSCRRPIFFHTRGDNRGAGSFDKSVSGKEVIHPPLLFAAFPKNLFVWALKEETRPTVATPLYRAPYYNLYDNGYLCEGNTQLPRTIDPIDIPIWEAAFFDTFFSHNNYKATLCRHPKGHNGYWREMRAQVRKKAVGFGAEYLEPVMTGNGKDAPARSMNVADCLNAEIKK